MLGSLTAPRHRLRSASWGRARTAGEACSSYVFEIITALHSHRLRSHQYFFWSTLPTKKFQCDCVLFQDHPEKTKLRILARARLSFSALQVVRPLSVWRDKHALAHQSIESYLVALTCLQQIFVFNEPSDNFVSLIREIAIQKILAHSSLYAWFYRYNSEPFTSGS